MQIEAELESESANNEAHVPVPFLVGTHGWAMFVATNRVGAFDVARKDPAFVKATFAVAPRTSGGVPETLKMWLLAPTRRSTSSRAATASPAITVCRRRGRSVLGSGATTIDDAVTLRKLDLATSALWSHRPPLRGGRARYPSKGGKKSTSGRPGHPLDHGVSSRLRLIIARDELAAPAGQCRG